MSIRPLLPLAVLCTPFALGQTLPAPNSTDQEKDPVELSPFVVLDETGSGYATTSSVTVSRVATKNTELPISAITINRQMIDDTLALSADETFNLVSGLYLGNAGTGTQENNTFSMRGYTSSSAQRDGVDDSLFTASGGFDYSLVESIEVMKGPNGILYGAQTSPGGVLNIVSKRPRAKPFTKLSVMGGSFDFYRAEIDTSQFLDSRRRFGFRLAGAITDNRGPVDWAADPRIGFRGINSSVSYRGAGGLEIWAWAGVVRDSSSRSKFMTRAFATSPQVSNSVAGASGAPLFDRAFIDGGAGQNIFNAMSEVNTDTFEFGASRSFSLGPIDFATRMIARYRDQLSDGSRVRSIGNDYFTRSSGGLIGPSSAIDNRFVSLSEVNDGQIDGVFRTGLRYDYRPGTKEDYSYGFDLNATVQLGIVHSQTLLTATWTNGDNHSVNSTYDITTASVLQSLGYDVVNGTPRVWIYPADKVVFGVDPNVLLTRNNTRSLGNTTFTDSTVWGVGVMERLSFFEGRRVVLMGGFRQTSTESTIRTTNNTGVIGAPQIREGNRASPGLAGLVKVYRGERGEAIVYANFNQTFIPVFTIDQRLATQGEKFPDRIAKTKEFGIKFDLLKSHVVATVSAFDNVETNVLRTLLDSDGSVTGVVDRTYSAPVGSRSTKGFEADVNVKYRNAEAVLGYSTQKARLDNGRWPEAIPDGTASALLTYRWRKGWLKGTSASYIYNRWGDFDLGTRTSWRVAGGELHNLALGYRWRNVDFRLRVSNLLDVRDAQPSVFDTAVGVTNPRSFRFGVTTTF
ncbi:MAG TPA: TonB-dependent receptor plug domain-containing protein [Opitutaceae bacterium]|nr:TonB-dependent receptor plug domain-containing protein [Opitutaceae bacterium]